jgi:hypothetical protein
MTKKDWNERVDRDKIVYDRCKAELKSAWEDAHGRDPARLNEIIQTMWDIAFEEGQQYVWFMRSGFGMNETESTFTATIAPDTTYTNVDGNLVTETVNLS